MANVNKRYCVYLTTKAIAGRVLVYRIIAISPEEAGVIALKRSICEEKHGVAWVVGEVTEAL